MDDGVLFALIFWAFILAVVCLPMLIRYRERRQLHETIRAFISRGEAAPAELIAAVRGRSIEDTPRIGAGRGLITGGIIVMFLAGGVVAYGIILGNVLNIAHGQGSEGMMVGWLVAGVGIVIGMVGAGLMTAGRVAARGIGKTGGA